MGFRACSGSSISRDFCTLIFTGFALRKIYSQSSSENWSRSDNRRTKCCMFNFEISSLPESLKMCISISSASCLQHSSTIREFSCLVMKRKALLTLLKLLWAIMCRLKLLQNIIVSSHRWRFKGTRHASPLKEKSSWPEEFQTEPFLLEPSVSECFSFFCYETAMQLKGSSSFLC